MEDKKNKFTGKLGFIMASAGSAVGLGNIWRFPYLAAKYGGGIFLLIYIILSITFGFSLSLTEVALGRKTQKSVVGAYSSLSKRSSFIGVLTLIVAVIIISYYCVIGGWVLKYFFEFLQGNILAITTDNYFSSFISQPYEPLIFWGIFLLLNTVIVLAGVQKGIENMSKILMPALVLLTIFMSVYILFLPGVLDGILYYIMPNLEDFSISTIIGAMGQLFYSLSIAMGVMITYGSYMKKDINIETSVHQITFFDTGIAFLAGFMIVPAVFIFSGSANINSGPGLMFETLPKVFQSMTNGIFVGIIFFTLVLFAAITSSVSLVETIVSVFQDKLKFKRSTACVALLCICILLGVPISLGNGIWSNVKIMNMNFLDFFDFISNNLLMPIVAFCTCIFVGYVIKPQAIIDEVELTAKFKWKKLFVIVIKYIAPIFLLLIFSSSVLSYFGILKL